MLDKNTEFLLHYLGQRDVKWKIDKPVIDLFGGKKQTQERIKFLYDEGYLVEDDHSYFLTRSNISQLKEILKGLSLSDKGKKQDLIDRIIENTTAEQRNKICPDLFYVLTDKAQEINDAYMAKQRENNRQYKAAILSSTLSGDIHAAEVATAEYNSRSIIQPAGVDWMDENEINRSVKNYKERFRFYDFSDLNNSPNYKDMLCRILYYEATVRECAGSPRTIWTHSRSYTGTGS